jgi:phi13 family phage major tail protein
MVSVCELLGIKYPIIQGAMAWIADAYLASAVSNAGGLGIIASGNADAEVVKDFNSGTLTLGVDDIGPTVAADLTGASTDDNGVLISASESVGTPVAVGFRAQKANGTYRYFWLYRVKFGLPATNLQTKADSITFSTPTIEGTVMRRNKLDGLGKHPWKAEVTEGDPGVSSSTITGWFTEVYEPVYTPEP